MNQFSRISVLLMVVALFIFNASVGFGIDGKQLYTRKFCITCHGKSGVADAPNYPNLAGQNPDYIKNQVRDIIQGKRKSKLSILMTDNPEVMNITDEEIAAIAAYLANLKRDGSR